ncbi:MAG: hypothetical protein KIS78_15785, partial [Labilithrix sp.]|nr:hypothetical protein [Labilithrix sp.]
MRNFEARRVDGPGMAFDSTQTATAETVEIEVVARAKLLLLEVQDEEGVRRVPVTRSPVVVGSSR